MKKIRVLVVDDEPLAREGVEVMLEGDSEIELIGTSEDGRSALAEIKSRRPDLVFLDVQMPRFGGLEVLGQLPANERPAVIFVTAHDRYAVQAFELCAVDYLLKPFRDERFHAALDRAKAHIRRAKSDEKQQRIGELVDYLRQMGDTVAGAPPVARRAGGGARLVFRVGMDHVFIETGNIAWLEAQGEHVKLYADGETHLVRESLQAMERRLDPAIFVRTHRSFIVNAGCVKRITPTMYGDYDVLTTDGAKLRMSRTFRDRLQVLLSAGAQGQ